MKPRLVILSDLWGLQKHTWAHEYSIRLQPYFDVIIYDACTLANINRSVKSEKKLHNQFINGGIETAVDKLLSLETQKITILAFSIGGTIAWKSALKGMHIEKLYAISATRLRYEVVKPRCKLCLYFAGDDPYVPNKNWFTKMSIEEHIFADEPHNMYAKKDIISKICEEILET